MKNLFTLFFFLIAGMCLAQYSTEVAVSATEPEGWWNIFCDFFWNEKSWLCPMLVTIIGGILGYFLIHRSKKKGSEEKTDGGNTASAATEGNAHITIQNSTGVTINHGGMTPDMQNRVALELNENMMNLKERVAALETAAKLNPTDNTEKVEQLQEELQKAIAQQPNAPEHWQAAAPFLLNKDFDGYQNELDKALQEDAARVAQTYYLKAEGYDAAVKYSLALNAYQMAVHLQPQNPSYLNALGRFLDNMALHDKAIDFLEKALENLQLHDKPDKLEGTIRNNLGAAWHKKGQYDKAIEYYEQALAIVKKAFGDEHPQVATGLNNLGAAWDNKGQYDKAIEYYEQALAILKKSFGDEHPQVANALNNLGLAWINKGQYDKAIEYCEKALAIDKKSFGDEHPQVATGLNNLGAAWANKGQYDKAIEYYEQALAIDKKVFGMEHPNVANGLNNLGQAWANKGQYDKAIGYYEQALAIDKKSFGDEHPQVATGLNNLGAAWYNKGQYDKAIEYCEQCLRILHKVFPDGHSYIDMTTESLARARTALANSKK